MFLFLALGACASKPKVYPNQHYKSVGKEQAQKDVDECIAEADKFLDSDQGRQLARGAGGGALVGAAIGGALGIFGGGIGQGALMGGTVGGAAGGASAALTPDQVKHNFVNHCLAERGYQVIGWR